MKLFANFIKTFKPKTKNTIIGYGMTSVASDGAVMVDLRGYSSKLYKAVKRAERTKRAILHSDIPDNDILCLIDDLRELQEEVKVWETLF